MNFIKFRAWHKEYEEMIESEECVDKREFTLVKFYFEDKHYSEKEEFIFMQYTGFKDKNGKEVYFDDILKVTFNDKDDPKECWSGLAQVVYALNNGVGLLNDWLVTDLWEDDDLWDIEVIGNIWENPELLKQV